MTYEEFIEVLSGHHTRSPVIVAELSGNHNRSLRRACELIEVAASCGVDAVKFQTYTADTITLNTESSDFVVNKPGSVWHGRSFYTLYEEAHTPWEWHVGMVAKAKALGLQWFSSPFDNSAVDFLETLGPACYKIASPEIVDLELIAKCVRTRRPLIMSTGMATVQEIDEAVRVAKSNGCTKLVLLKCTTDYPASPENSNVQTIPHMAELFGCPCGLSDHTLGIGAAVAATALGAVMIEKHLTLRRSDGGPDSHFSLEPGEMKALVQETKEAFLSLGRVQYGPQDVERASLQGRRSLYITTDMKAGDVFSHRNVRSVRPGYGLPPKYLEVVIGRKIKRDAVAGTALDWDIVS